MATSDLPDLEALVLRAERFANLLDGATCTKFQKSNPEKVAEVDQFRSKVQTLRLKKESLNMWLRKSGKLRLRCCASLDIGSIAVTALKALQAEEPVIRKLNQPWRSCITVKFSRRHSDIPVLQLTAALQRVIDAFDSIPGALSLTGSRKSSISPLDGQTKIRQSRLPFGTEKRYVPLRRSVARIRRALESQHGPQVVVMHGAAGTGKSILARYLALYYQDGEALGKSEEELRDSFQFTGGMLTRQMSRSDIASPATGRFPDGVFYVPCTRVTDIVAKQLQLLQDLGFTPPVGKLSHLSHNEMHSRLQKKLVEYFGTRDALVVIDNVSDPNVVRWLLTRNSNVKYLVTTQDATLCEDDAQCLSIQIEQVGYETARKILASQSTKLDHPDFQEVLDALVNLTMANPLALMNVSMTIVHSNDVEEWKDARSNFETFLSLCSGQERSGGDPESDPMLNSSLIPPEIPRVIGCSIMLALDSLPLGVENLLVAVAALDGHVPQVVVQFLVKGTQGNLASFSRCRNFLEDRALIHLHRQMVWWSSSMLQTSWCIDGPLQRFIQIKKVKAVESIVDSLINRAGNIHSADRFDSDYTLTVALCAIYGSPKVADEAARKLGCSNHISDMQARIWAAPLVSLLQATDPRTDEEKRKQKIHTQARQVLLEYVFNEISATGGMRGLLRTPIACQHACWAIAWAVPNQKRALYARSSETLEELVSLLTKEDELNSDVQECATAALWNLSMAAETKVIVVETPGLLAEIVQLLHCVKNANVQRHAVGIVAGLASEKENQLHLAAFPGLVRGLVGLLKDYLPSSNVQVYAAHAIMHLASAWPNKVPIASFPRALERLVQLMEGSGCLHEIAVGAVVNLSIAPENKSLIACAPGALDNLVRLLEESSSVLAQKRAATALVNITTHTSLLIRPFPSALEKVVGLLSKVGRPELQEVAAKILGNLAVGEENAETIAGFPNAWRGLLTLSGDGILEVRMQALDTIGLLVGAMPLSQVPAAIEELFLLLSEDANPSILEKTLTAILQILDARDGRNFIGISKFPSSLDRLVDLLGQFDFPQLQETAASVLAALGKWKPNRIAIAHFPRALGLLVELLAKDVKPSVKMATLRTLWHVAYSECLPRKIIAQWPGSLHSIMALLEGDVEPGVQVGAALVLSTLAGVNEKYVDPEEIPSLLEKLKALLLTKDKVNPSVQQEAAKTRTLLDSESSNLLTFTSSDAYAGRGRANAQLGMLRQALADFNVALQAMWDKDFTLQRDRLDSESQVNASPTLNTHELELDILHGKIAHVLSNRAYVKAVLKDYQGALRDADSALELQPRDSLLWQERGILKQLAGALPGALADLKHSLQIAPDNYESLKHCGYVHFLSDNFDAAYTIAARALEIDLHRGYDPPDGDEYCRLGKLPVTFLGFTLS